MGMFEMILKFSEELVLGTPGRLGLFQQNHCFQITQLC